MNFNKSIKVLSVGLLLGLSACGSGSEPAKNPVTAENSANKATTATSSAATASALPQMLIARVPVGADGQEDLAQVETREVATAGAMSSDSVANTFSAGSAVTVADELDADSSTQQHYNRRSWYWNTPWYPGKALGRGLWWGHNPYVYYGGSSYPYYYGSSYYYNGCNYYTYYSNYNYSGGYYYGY